MGTLGTLKMVSQMSVRCWEKVEEIFSLYEQVEIKGQKAPKNQLGLPDCKKSNWQFLHNLAEQQQYQLLSDLADKQLSFKEAEVQARQMKKEAKVWFHVVLCVMHVFASGYQCFSLMGQARSSNR